MPQRNTAERLPGLALGLGLATSLLAMPAWAQDGGFRSPTGNIHCALAAGELRCDIGQRSYQPPPQRPRNPDCDYGNYVGMQACSAPEMLCVTDTAMNPDHPVLPYGSTWNRSGFACTSAQNGVRCTNREGRGWEMSRARLQLF